MMLSDRLGRTTSKEQYAFFYKTSTVSVVNSYQWPDVNDVFEREPYIVRFRPLTGSQGDFAFAGIHVKPEKLLTRSITFTTSTNPSPPCGVCRK